MSAHEYTPTEHESTNGNGNPDHSDSENSIAPKLRNAAQNDARLSDGAKVLFDRLTDLSFLHKFSPARGVVKIAKKKLAGPDHLRCSVRKIQRNTSELIERRFIWTELRWEGGFEITYWFIRNMADPQAEFWNDGANPCFGSKTGRKEEAAGPVRNGHGQFCRREGSGSEFTDLPANTPVNGQKCPETPVKSDPCQRSNLTVVNGQNCPVSAVKSDRRHGSNLTVDTGQICPASGDKSDRRLRTELTGIKESPDDYGVNGATSKRLGNRAVAAAQEASTDAENEFLQLCLEVFGVKEMKQGGPKGEGNGGLWRTLYRQNRDKAWRVLRETQTVKKERPDTLKTTWGAYAMDLWLNRFEPVAKRKAAV